MAKVSATTARKLRVVRDQILRAPQRFDMGSWAEKSACGTACCIAGYGACNEGISPAAIIRADYDLRGLKADEVPTELRRKLRMGRRSTRDMQQIGETVFGIKKASAEVLFYNNAWPQLYRDAFESANTLQEKACIAAARIEHFIATGE